jgi:hypothetical protein
MKAILTILAALAILAAPVSADVLWDQSDYDPFGAGFFNSVSGGPPFGITNFVVSDVTVDGSGWNVSSITTYYSFLDVTWGTAISEGHLCVFPRTGPLPLGTDDPTTTVVVPMTGVDIGGVWQITAAGLNLDLAPGDYWIGITPIAPSGPFGPEIHLGAATFVGIDVASYDPFAFPGPPAWFNYNPGTDATILIEGTRPTPVEDTTWSQIKSIYR